MERPPTSPCSHLFNAFLTHWYVFNKFYGFLIEEKQPSQCPEMYPLPSKATKSVVV